MEPRRSPRLSLTAFRVAWTDSRRLTCFGWKPRMPLSILSNIAREAPLGSLLFAFLLGIAIARRR